MIHNFLVLNMLPPTLSPIGVMDNSAPKEKNTMPIITSTAPTMNSTSILGERGAIVKPRSNTISIIGTTALTDSFVFSFIFSLTTVFW